MKNILVEQYSRAVFPPTTGLDEETYTTMHVDCECQNVMMNVMIETAFRQSTPTLM